MGSDHIGVFLDVWCVVGDYCWVYLGCIAVSGVGAVNCKGSNSRVAEIICCYGRIGIILILWCGVSNTTWRGFYTSVVDACVIVLCVVVVFCFSLAGGEWMVVLGILLGSR